MLGPQCSVKRGVEECVTSIISLEGWFEEDNDVVATRNNGLVDLEFVPHVVNDTTLWLTACERRDDNLDVISITEFRLLFRCITLVRNRDVPTE